MPHFILGSFLWHTYMRHTSSYSHILISFLLLLHSVVEDQSGLAQRSEVMIRALLAMSEVETLRWLPQRALGHAGKQGC